MVICLKFSNGNQRKFLLKVKERLYCSWDQIAKDIGVHRQTIFAYLRESCMMSKNNFIKLCKISKLNQNKFDYKEIIVMNEEIKIKYPKLSRDLSEFIGILAGDGHISAKEPYEVSIVAHKILDKNLIEDYLYNLIKKLFNINPNISYQKNKVKIRSYSRKLREFLINEYHLPYGNKLGKLKIPEVIKQNPNYLKTYIRGLFDTDGSFHRHHKNTACVEISSNDSKFLQDVKEAFNKLNFKSSVSSKNLYIYDTSEIHKFFKEIGSKNFKNIIKYERFKKEGKVPTNKEIMPIMHQ